MSMVTRCPHCQTQFRVTPEQLQVRAGRVRCGHCAQVFDGFKALTTLDAVETPQADAVAATAFVFEETQRPVADTTAPEMALEPLPDMPSPAGIPAPEVAAETVAPISEPAVDPLAATMPMDAFAAEATAETSTPVAMPASDTKLSEDALYTNTADVYARLNAGDALTRNAARDGTAATAASAFELNRDDEAEKEQVPPRRIHRGWAIAASLAAFVLVAQTVHAYRSEITAYYPGLKPALAQWCGWARCVVPPLQRPAALKIEASDLQVVDPVRPQIVQLTATLRNYETIDIGYPALDLVLTDAREHALARRVFLPADYLRLPDAANAAIAANGEVTVRIDLDVSELAAAGFRLNLSSVPSI